MIMHEQQNAASAFRTPGSGDWEALAGERTRYESQHDARETKDELKNTLLASLQMEDLVVLAGSGCS